MTGRGRREASERRSGIREVAGDGATGHSVKAFPFGEIGNAWERKPSG